MKYVIGVDLVTSSAKVLLVSKVGDPVNEVSNPYPLIQEKSGYYDWIYFPSVTALVKPESACASLAGVNQPFIILISFFFLG